MIRPGPLPTYAWARTPVAGVPRDGWERGLPAVTALDPGALPDAPPATTGDLVQLGHPLIRTLGAYWHEGWPFARPETWVRTEVADRLGEAAERLPAGFGLAVWDAWRDPRLQQSLHDTVYQDPDLPPGFVAEPHPDPRLCPPHATGGTVDLTLTWHQEPLALGTGFDAFVPAAAAAALEPDGPQPARDLRRLLAFVMSGVGFVVHPQEWWHWEFGTRFWGGAHDRRPRYGRTAPPVAGPPVTAAASR